MMRIYLIFSTNNYSPSSGGAVCEPLPWSLRLKILIGAARGLAFLGFTVELREA
uniref:Uncharacterized protein n=1 Tax=Arundo donax TaxID=35708 RepID=A0A0A9HAX7_ARUDO